VNGPLSITIDCTVSSGMLTATVNAVSTAANWLDSGTAETTGSQFIDEADDGGSQGSQSGGSSLFDLVATGGQQLRGSVTFGVNWPNPGGCFADGFAVS
jgi:hypothetical protein